MSPTTLVLLMMSIFQKGMNEFLPIFCRLRTVDSYYNCIALCLLENLYFVILKFFKCRWIFLVFIQYKLKGILLAFTASNKSEFSLINNVINI